MTCHTLGYPTMYGFNYNKPLSPVPRFSPKYSPIYSPCHSPYPPPYSDSPPVYPYMFNVPDVYLKCYNEMGQQDQSLFSGHRSPSDSLTTEVKGRKQKEDKYCGVCGDRALGYNFDAISCESCKAFFRRNAPKSLEYFKCPYDNNCKMDISNRRFCKRCRLRKCFDIGMRKEYILTDEEKRKKRQRIEENRRNKNEEKFRMQISDISTSDEPFQVRDLESYDSENIDELNQAFQMSLHVGGDANYPRDCPPPDQFTHMLNIAELSIRRVIDMSKKIKIFKALSQADQINLLKGGSIELLIIRAVISFDKDKSRFLDSTDSEDKAMTTAQLAQGDGNLYGDLINFVKSLAINVQVDNNVVILLLMICLFSPDRHNVADKQSVGEAQEKYAMLLQRYLLSLHPVSIVSRLYPRLLMKLTEIRDLTEQHSQMLLQMNPDGLLPLMKEVLEMNLPKRA